MWVLIVKQKTAYERRSSDWSSDVCSSDLQGDDPQARRVLVGDEDELRPCVADIGPVILQLRDQHARRGAGLRQIDERDGVAGVGPFGSSEALRVGKECVSTCTSRSSPYLSHINYHHSE